MPASWPLQSFHLLMLVLSHGIHSLPRPFQTGNFSWVPGHCFLSGLHHFPGGSGCGFQSKATECALQTVFFMASASLALSHPSLKSSGWNQMPVGQSPCCLALHSTQARKPGASLGLRDCLWAGDQSPAKHCFFSCCGCMRPGLHPRE